MGYAISEARRQLPALIKRALFDREEIHLGERGSDAVTLVATDVYEETKALAQQTLVRRNQRDGTTRPFAALESALRRGGVPPLAVRSEAPGVYRRARRYIADFQAESRIDERAQAVFGARANADTAAPILHRRRPRGR